MTTTTPTPAPAPMTAERLREISIRCASESSHVPLRVLGAFEVAQLLAHIDALTARVAELERERDEARQDRAAALRKQLTEAMKVALHSNQKYKDRADKAESELAAARKDEDKEVSEFIDWLRLEQNEPGISAGLAWRYERTQQLLSALSAALKEAGQRASDHLRASEILNRHCVRLEARAQAAEAKLETARRDALEEAASLAAEYGRAISKGLRRSAGPNDTGEQIAESIRALQTKDTTE